MKKFTLLLGLSIFFSTQSFAQFGEPDLIEQAQPRILLDEGYNAGFGFSFALSDFGFGAGGQFRLGVARYTEAIVSINLSAIKDPTEQTFNYYFGGKVIPNKYRRVISVPLLVGLKRRFFAAQISDNFRLFGTLSGGPVLAWSIPYFVDSERNGFRENDIRIYGFAEPVNDIFQGWDQAETHWGMGGHLAVGIDFGDNFANLNTVQFGYTMNYFTDGIQILEPTRPDIESFVYEGGNLVYYETLPANSPRKYFGSAKITFIFGWMW